MFMLLVGLAVVIVVHGVDVFMIVGLAADVM